MTVENQQPDWSQLAELRPRLQRHMNTFSQVYRGDRWYVLHDASNATHLRFNGPAYECIGRFDGELTLDEIWKIVSKKLGDDAPTQTEIIMILAQLFSIGAIRGGISVNAKEFLKKLNFS